MTHLRTFDNLINKIFNKLSRYQKESNKVNKKEIEDFIYFLRKNK